MVFENKIKNKAFTVTELAISMLVMAILITGTMSTTVMVSKISDVKNTKTTMVTIEDAVEEYLATNKRLPCPASLTLTSADANFGEELRDGNDECDTTAAGIYYSGNLIYGTVPVKDLNLKDADIADAWDNKISYVVDKRFTMVADDSGAEDGFAFTSGYSYINTLINVTSNGTANTITNEALFTLISHGENGLGAYALESTTQNDTTNIIAEEDENIYKSGFDNTFVSQAYKENFDDIVYSKTKMQLVRDVDWGDIGCPKVEANFQDDRTQENIIWSSNGIHKETIAMNNIGNGGTTADTFCYMKTCGKYGRWSDMTYCNPTTQEKFGYELPVKYGLTMWFDSTDPETIVLHSNYDYTTMNIGTWKDKSGNGHDLSQTTGTSAPALRGDVINGLPGVYFNADVLARNILGSKILSADEVTLVIVNKHITATDSSPFSAVPPESMKRLNIHNPWVSLNRVIFDGPQNDRIFIDNPAGTVGDFNIWLFNKDYSSVSSTHTNTIYLNNESIISQEFSPGTQFPITDGFLIRAGVNMDGYIVEILLYNRALSGEERNRVSEYLSDKYDIQLN